MERHTILGGKVQLYRRPETSYWHCAASLAGRQHRTSTREDSLARAKDFAEDWYLTLRGKIGAGEIIGDRNFKRACKLFIRDYEAMTAGQRNPKYVRDHRARIDNHLIPYFGELGLAQITAGKIMEYRLHRLNPPEGVKVPSRSTLHHEIVTLRQILKTAVRHGLLKVLPDLSMPYRSSTKITHRAWFSPEEYKTLYGHTRERAKKAQGKKWQWAAEQMHDYVLFMANTGIRPDEANRLEFRDVKIAYDKGVGAKILEIEVRGKRGVGYCKSMPGAVRPFERLAARPRPRADPDKPNGNGAALATPQPTDKVFPANHKKQFNDVLDKLGFKFDRDGNRRAAYSLRHTYICLRLMEGADIYQIAKNCRTSVDMIEKYYARHIKDRIDAAAINVRKQKTFPKKRAKTGNPKKPGKRGGTPKTDD